jgi:hypothetical protein
MKLYISSLLDLRVPLVSGLAIILIFTLASSSSAASSYSSHLRRYPYLTDTVISYATVNWATDRSNSSGGVRWGKVGSESCTAHYVPASRTAISVNTAGEFQWKALLDLTPGAQYCYRIYLGSSPETEVDLLGSDPAPSFWTQVPSGSSQPYSFVVFGDWGFVDASGTNPYQANLMSLMPGTGARFAVTTGDNSYPSGSQSNYGDLLQTGSNISAVFGPSFWKGPGASLPIYPVMGNHGMSNSDASHPYILNWPQDRAVAASRGRYVKETYCCLDGTTSASYPSGWYAFDAGAARFYLLDAAWGDSNIGSASSYKVDYDYHWTTGSAEYKWLQADLAAHSSVLKFAFLHWPLYTDSTGEVSDTLLQGSNNLEGLLKQNGVNIAFSGHAHIYERNLPSPTGLITYVTGGGGAPLGDIKTCTSLDAYAIKFTSSGKGCGSAPKPTNASQVYDFLLVTVNGTNVKVSPINSLGQTFDEITYNFSNGVDSTPPSKPTNLTASAVNGTQVDLAWAASSDNKAVRGYDLYRNGELVYTTDATTLGYSDSNLIPSTTYVYSIDAFDGSGNHSALSTTVSTITSAIATYTFPPVADSYVVSNAATTNNGLSSVLKVDASPEDRSYLRFNVNGLNGVVNKAILKLYTTSTSTTGYQIHSVADQSWDEISITYANAPAAGPVINSLGNFNSGNWTSVDVSSFITGNGVYDLALTTTSSSSISFNSRDATTNQPQLIIDTTTGAVTPTVTTTATATSTNAPTNTPTATFTNSPTATSPETATATNTPGLTSIPTATPTSTVTNTAAVSSTPTNTMGPTITPTSTASPTPANTPTIGATKTPTATPTATQAGTSFTLTPVADSYVDTSNAGANFGTATTFRVDGSPVVNSYLRFTVPSLSGGTISQVRLLIWANSASSTGIAAKTVADNTWGETTITASNAPPMGSTLATSPAVVTGTWVTYDVTTYIIGQGTFSFGLSTSGATAISLASRESGAHAPQLIVDLH